MASHRKPRPTGTRAGIRTPVLATAALTSVALLSQTAQAAPVTADKPSVEEVQKKVDTLYRQAESATEKYNAAKEKTTTQRKQVDRLLDDVAKRAQKLNDARQELGSFAAAQYRSGTAADTTTFLLADSPQGYFDQDQLMNRLTSRQKSAVDDYVTEQATTMKKRAEAAKSLEKLTTTQTSLKTAKATVQTKLSTARELLSKLTAQEKARLAQIEKEKQEKADAEAAALAKKQAAEQTASQGSGSSSTTTVPANTSQAAQVIAFARAQIGKPYVWGATGPDSYDCSGLTQAAYRSAGVTLPRVTTDQVNAGTTVSLADAQPGDLIFFYSDVSHVGIYIGDGMMIHAPKPGAYVREESIYYGGSSIIHSVVRPA